MFSNIRSVIFLVNDFRKLQNYDGSVKVSNLQTAHEILKKILFFTKLITINNASVFLESFRIDIETWIDKGLQNEPDFYLTRDSYVSPKNNEYSFFIGVVKSQNSKTSKGFFLECFLVKREEPIECEVLYKKFPHPKNICQSTKLICGSNGVFENNCIVFFPENIKSSKRIFKQNFALFFFNKFKKIFEEQTLKNIDRLNINLNDFSKKGLWSYTSCFSEQEIYISRCIWGYLHDYHHHQGIKPFDEFISLKTNWFVGLLEEVKVDFQTFLECIENDLPYSKLVAQYILFDRIFRYPFQEDRKFNFDSGTGVFIYNWFINEGVIINKEFDIFFNVNKINESANKLISKIVEIESLEDHEEIKEKSFYFVNEYVGVSKKREIIDFREFKKVLELSKIQVDV